MLEPSNISQLLYILRQAEASEDPIAELENTLKSLQESLSCTHLTACAVDVSMVESNQVAREWSQDKINAACAYVASSPRFKEEMDHVLSELLWTFDITEGRAA